MERKRTSTTIKWKNGPFKGRDSSLRYDRYGQRFQLKTRIRDQFYKFHCFQRGASDRYAQTSFRLRTPQPGSYRCNELETGKQQILKLTVDGSYLFGNVRGGYRVEDIIGRPGESSSKLIWASGSLAEEGKDKSARYSEEEGTGLRTLRISTTWNRFVMGTGGSSSKLSALCTAKGKLVAFEKYGAGQALSPPKTAGGLEGFYYTMEGITGKRMLVVHMFRHSMVKNKSDLKKYANIDIIFNLDGHGSPRLKTDIYNAIYTKRVAHEVAGGFKLFFGEDKPRLMTPKQVLGLESVSGGKIKEMPKFINYQ